MNKRFFTLMAAVMLAGSPFTATEAFAAGDPDYVVATDADVALASGMQFYLSDGAKYLKVINGDSDGTFYNVALTTDEDEAAKFEIKAYSGGTFQLWVGGKRVYQDAGKQKGVFYALNGGGATTKFDFTNIKTFAVGSTGTDLISGLTSYAPYTKQLVLDAEDLNANLSKRGFALQFPDANSAPELNLFGQKMVAVDASTVASKLTLSGTYSNLMFVIADADGNKLLNSGFTKAQAEAATFVVVSPSKNYGITGFDKSKGEGYEFTTVKGAKLATANKAADGKIAIDNGIFKVTEEDMLAEAGMYTIQASIKVNVSATNETSSAQPVYIGAYSLNAGGIKTYITTKSDAQNLVKASTNGTSYAQAADLLSSSGAAIYNISFCGTMPETKQDAETSFYGKYLVTDIDVTSTPAFEFDAEAPADVNKKAADAQWVVTGFNGKGEFTFANLENGTAFSAKLYKTDDDNVYEFSSDDITADGTEKVRLTTSAGIESFLTLTDAQLKQGATLTFHGEGSVNVNDVYMDYDFDRVNNEWHIVPSTDADRNIVWQFAKAGSVKKKLAYAYLKDGVVTPASVDTLETTTYFLTVNGWDLKNVGTTGASTDYQVVQQTVAGTPAGDRFAFKMVDGEVVVYAFGSTTPAAYTDIVKANPNLLFLNKKNAQFVYNTAKRMDAENAYVAASIDFYTLGESLPAVSRHATINSEDGSVSFKENKNGILEGIIASEGMTFWLDTADTDADMPTFYLSKGIAVDTTAATKAYSEEVRNFMLYPADLAYYWSDDEATYVTDKAYYLEGTGYNNLKAVFSPAALVAEDTLSTADGLVTKKNGLNNYKYYITKYGDGYIVSPAAAQNVFLYNLNGKLGFTTDLDQALVINLGEGDATANEAVEAETVKVIGGQGVVTVQGAAGKVVTVANILGQTLANQVAASDNVTIAVPAGIVVVAVDGEATKVVVK